MQENKILYHYTTTDIACNILLSKRLKLSRYDNLNDEFELQPIKIHGANQRDSWNETMDNFSKNKGFVSFSNNHMHPVMWGQYSEKGKGICLGFEVKNTVQMNYIDNLIDFPKDKIDFTEKFIEKASRTKFRDWEYEEEYRLEKQIEEENPSSWFVPFSDELNLKEVHLGVKNNLDLNTFRRNMEKLYSDIHVIKVGRASRSFRLLKGKK